MEPRAPEKPAKTIPERISDAWEPLKESLSVQLFGVATVAEVMGLIFEWHKKLEAMHAWPHWAPTLNLVIYSFLAVFGGRTMFLLAERNGELRRAVSGAGASLDSHNAVVATLHDIIHETRDSLLTDKAFWPFLVPADNEPHRHLFDIWQRQLGIIQKGMRSLTGSDCNVCIKLVRKDRIAPGVDGLSTVCYGPAVPTERRQRSCVLPLNQGIAQEAIVTKTIAYANDILKDDRFWPRERKEECAKYYRTVVAAPIIVDRVVRGVLCFDWPTPDQFSPSHRHAVACYTDMVSTAYYFNELGRKLSSEYQPQS